MLKFQQMNIDAYFINTMFFYWMVPLTIKNMWNNFLKTDFGAKCSFCFRSSILNVSISKLKILASPTTRNRSKLIFYNDHRKDWDISGTLSCTYMCKWFSDSIPAYIYIFINYWLIVGTIAFVTLPI